MCLRREFFDCVFYKIANMSKLLASEKKNRILTLFLFQAPTGDFRDVFFIFDRLRRKFRLSVQTFWL